jgi:gliding motility-associated-like protein
MTEVITLHGSDFGDDPEHLKVFFGGAKGEIKNLNDHVILVRTPYGATFDAIRVTNSATGLTAEAPRKFFLNYKGDHGIASPGFSAQSDFQAQSGLYDLCLADFNDDGKLDVATASNNSNIVTLFQNNSTPGNLQLIPKDFVVNARTLHAQSGDLNSDGRPDIILTEGADGNRVFILRNNGGFNFALQTISLPGIKVKQVAVQDLDLDGKPELVVTNTGGNALTILPNQSTLATISFSTALSLALPQASSTDAVAIGDLNQDGFPEIITSQYQADSGNKLFIIVNKGLFDFSDINVITVNKAISSIRLADVDADSKPDLVVARLTGSDISVYRNMSTSDIAFDEPSFFITESLPVGMDFSDFDGDGRLDIAVGSIARSVSVLNNIGTGTGTSAFAPVVKLSATFVNRNLRAADMDGDGKPDIVFTSVDDFSGVPVPASRISVMRNLGCMVPSITPEGPLTICAGNPLQLKATSGGGTIYQWRKEGSPSPLKTGSENFLEVATSGTFKVTALGAGSCSKESALVQVTETSPSAPLLAGSADAQSNSPVCSDNALLLRVNDLGATEYKWRGPDGFSQSATTPELQRLAVTRDAAGLYVVDMIAGNCVAKTDSTLVEVLAVPDFAISFSGDEKFCAGAVKALTVTPDAGSGFAYQWYERTTGMIAGAVSNAYAAQAGGEYYATVTPPSPGCAAKETPAVTLTTLEPPVANFHMDASACTGVAIAFTQQSTSDPAATVNSQWTFGNGKSSSETDPSTSYETAGIFEVTLTLSYEGITGCTSTRINPIAIVAPVIPQIVSSATTMCEGEAVSLSVYEPFPSIKWSTGITSSAIDIPAPGEYSVQTIDANGCASDDHVTIVSKPVPVLTVSADKTAIAAGQSVTLHATGADLYQWSPGRTLNDSTISDPVASPQQATTYTVRGSLMQGCADTASVTIQVNGEVVNIKVPALFSPNGDNANETLVIEGVENYPDCSLNVFDRRGGKVFSTHGYQNNWDGTYNGSPLPEGVYFYVFTCPNNKAKTGTIALIH